MYQVTAIYQGSEIGYGEGEGVEYATEECIDSLPGIFTESIFNNDISKDQIDLLVLHSSGSKTRLTLRDHQDFGILAYIG